MDLDLHDIIRLVNSGMLALATLALLWLIYEVRRSRRANQTSLGAVRRAVYDTRRPAPIVPPPTRVPTFHEDLADD
jgi:hypothetical protein